jgi:hypothetical protein
MIGDTEEAHEKARDQNSTTVLPTTQHSPNCSQATQFQLTRQYDDTDVSNSLAYTKSNAISSHSAVNTSM